RVAERHAEEIAALLVQEEERGELPLGARTGLVDVASLAEALDTRAGFDTVREAPSSMRALADLGWTGVDSYAGRFDAFTRAVRDAEARGDGVIVVTRQQRRVEELAAEHGLDTIDAAEFDASATPLGGGACLLVPGDLSQGFTAGTGVSMSTPTRSCSAPASAVALHSRGAFDAPSRRRRAVRAGPRRAAPRARHSSSSTRPAILSFIAITASAGSSRCEASPMTRARSTSTCCWSTRTPIGSSSLWSTSIGSTGT